MNIAHSLSRRSLLKLAVFHALGAALPLTLRSGQVLADLPNDSREALAKMVNGLYSHEGFPDSVYERIAAAIADAVAASPESSEMVEKGLAALEEAIPDGDWEQIDQAQLEEILESVEAEPFFGFVKNQAMQLLYSDPEVWELIGYGGSSIEHGGYINRGFNDIDWLPEAEQ